MKSKFTQRRYRAPKRSSCAMCKPQQRGWTDKNGVTGASDMAGKAVRVAVEPSGSELDTMERLGRATWPEGWDHDLGGVFNGRAQREPAEIQNAGRLAARNRAGAADPRVGACVSPLTDF
jgi:hypothetical protein